MKQSFESALPPGESEASLLEHLGAFHQRGLDERARAEFRRYLEGDLRRFVLTLGLVPDRTGRLLEVGAHPYFTTLLLRRFRNYELTLTNGYGPARFDNTDVLATDNGGEVRFTYARLNLERDDLPFERESFDVTLCCEVIEHMTTDPLRALATLNESLVPGGTLVLTTPNAARADVAGRVLAGLPGHHDQYSAYGPYGRHNREYVADEMRRLLEHAGFEIEVAFSADVHPSARRFRPAVAAARLVIGTLRRVLGRDPNLGGYLFFRAVKRRPPDLRKPAWLYRSYSADEMSLP
jgi:SAM-dependent methyltransferase